jgi:hypothetical protein
MFIKEKNKKTELTKLAQNWKNSELKRPYENCGAVFKFFSVMTLLLYKTLLTVNLPKISNAMNSNKNIVRNRFVLLSNK